MKTVRETLRYDSKQKNQVIPITDDIKKVVEDHGIEKGTLFAYSLHTTLSLVVQEALEPNLCQDIIDQMVKCVDDDGKKYNHTCAKHPSGTCRTDSFNGPSHVRQLLTNQNLILDIEEGKLKMGQWQDIAAIEFDGPRENRGVMIKIIEE